MKSVFLGICLVLFMTAGFGQNYQPVDKESAIKFSIKNFGLTVSGSFSGLMGTIRFNPTEPGTSVINVTVDARTINTGSSARDNHLRKEEYFNVQKYPTISFISKQVTSTEKTGTYTVTGNITIKGVSKEISFPFNTAVRNEGMVFTGEFKLNRRDFKVGGSSLVLSDNLIVSLSVFAKKK